MRNSLLLLLLTALFSSARAEVISDASLARLANVSICAFGPVGYAGKTSDGEKDYQRLMLESPARSLELFESLYAKGNSQGKCYALIAIHRLSPDRFNAIYLPLAMASTSEVSLMHGCILDHEALRKIAMRLQKGEER